MVKFIEDNLYINPTWVLVESMICSIEKNDISMDSFSGNNIWSNKIKGRGISMPVSKITII